MVRGINNIFATHSAGAGVSLASDQRGFLRPTGQPADIGAFQTTTAPLVVTTTADAELTVAPGLLSLRDAFDLAGLESPATPLSISFDPTVFCKQPNDQPL